jgi:uncharacterized protein
MPTIEDARDWYKLDDPVHGWSHIIRVTRMAERLAAAEQADMEIVRAAALLHDAEGGGADENRKEHQHASSSFAAQILSAEGWSEDKIAAVQHCIRSHRFRDQSEKPQTLEAKVLFDADKLDAIGALGAVRAIAYAVLAGQDLYAYPSDQFIQTGEKEPDESHTPYHEYLYKLRKLKDQIYTESGRSIAEKRHHFLENFFIQLLEEIQCKG